MVAEESVEFIGLDMTRIVLPVDLSHLFVENCALSRSDYPSSKILLDNFTYFLLDPILNVFPVFTFR